MATPESELRSYDELIGSLEDKLGGLSAVHQGLAEAARSLVEAHRELDAAKRGIELLTTSSQAILDEVRRLQPDELAARLDAGLARFSREMSESQGALSEPLLALAREAARAGEQADAQFAQLGQRLASQEETVTTRLSAAQAALTESSAATRRAVIEVVADSHQATQSALGGLRDHHETLRQAIADVQRRQGDHTRRLDDLLALVAQLQHHQAHLAQQLTSVSEAAIGIRGVADATRSAALANLQASERFGPTLSTALERTRNDLVAEIARSKRIQIVSLVVIVIAIALAWTALEGLIPPP